MQLKLKLPVSGIPRILKDETHLPNSRRERGGLLGRGTAESETKRRKGGGNIRTVGWAGGRAYILERVESCVQLSGSVVWRQPRCTDRPRVFPALLPRARITASTATTSKTIPATARRLPNKHLKLSRFLNGVQAHAPRCPPPGRARPPPRGCQGHLKCRAASPPSPPAQSPSLRT